MQGIAHRRTTQEAFKLLGVESNEEIIKESVYPDYVKDIEACGELIKGFDLWGNAFTSFQHFCIPNSTNPKTNFRGYSFALDKSLVGLNLKDFPIKFHANEWFKEWSGSLIDSWIAQHPMLKILNDPSYTNKSFDEITYITVAVLAEWLEKGLQITNEYKAGAYETIRLRNKIIASMLHCIQDVCMRPHSHGEILNGHKEYEMKISAIIEDVITNTKFKRITRKWKGIRKEVERCAYYSYLSGKDIDSMKSMIKMAVESSAFVLENVA